MAILVKHNFNSPIADSGNPNEIGPNEWNDGHAFTMATGFILGRTSAGAGVVQELPIANFDSTGKANLAGGNTFSGNQTIQSSATSNSPVVTIQNTSGATGGGFGPILNFSNGVAGTHGYNISVMQTASSDLQIANNLSPYNLYFNVTQDHRIGIGCAATANGSVTIENSNNQTKLYIAGYGSSLGYGAAFRAASAGTVVPAVFQNNSGTDVGSIQTTATATSYVTSSDARRKKNIQDAGPATQHIENIKIRQFDWIVNDHHENFGVIAQELKTVAPYAVTGQPDDTEMMMAVDYSKLVPLLIKGLQELRAEFDAYKAAHP